MARTVQACRRRLPYRPPSAGFEASVTILNPTRPYPTSAPPDDDEGNIAAEIVQPTPDLDAPPEDPSSAESELEAPVYIRHQGYRALPSPGIAINTIESRIADDLAYRAHQTLFLSPCRVLPSPGTIAINTIESRIADDFAYRAHQTLFLSPRRAGALARTRGGPKSLESLAVDKVVESLRYDPKCGLEAMRRSPTVLQEMVLDRLHYVSFRGIQTLLQPGVEDLITKEAAIDLEVWIIKNELMMRQEPASVEGLVMLDDDLDIVFPGSTVKGMYREIRRRVPPKSNFCFFDQMKPVAIKIQNTTDGYVKTFRGSTAGILEGLDWDNVFVAGGIALNTLLRVDEELSAVPVEPGVAPAHAHEQGDKSLPEEGAESSAKPPSSGPEKCKGWVSADRDSDIDVYIYGITDPQKANDKIRHIYSVWAKNIDAAATAAGKKENEMPKKLVIRNSKTVNFLSDYPHRRIQVILKFVASPTEVLLNFDLDPCAIGFNGKEVFMLPRCARALETGYSVFTTDLVEGHHLGDRRETQLPRVYKYADRGFGIRILPQYLRTLKTKYWSHGFTNYQDFYSMDTQRPKYQEPPIQNRDPTITEKSKILRGRKLITRLAYYEEDFVHRFWVAPTYRSKGDRFSESDYEEMGHAYDRNGNYNKPSDVSLAHFDGRFQYVGDRAPHGRNGLGGFQLFYRHAALWVKEKEGLLKIVRDSFMSPCYEPDGYSELPKYEWNTTFKVDEYAESIAGYNSMIYGKLRNSYNHRQGRYADAAFTGFFARRTEKLCCGYDLDEQLERELAVPVYIPQGFENYANKIVMDVLKEKGIFESSGADFNLLIPVHGPGMGLGVIQETQRGGYNWAFWLIGPSVAWARLDRKIDEIFEVLWNFFNIYIADDFSGLFQPGNEHAWSGLLKEHLDRRASRIPPKRAAATTATEETKTFVWPDEREKRLFKKWMIDVPLRVDRDMQGYQGDMGHRKYSEEDDVMPKEREYWRKTYEEGSLEEWLNWGEYMEVGKAVEAGKRKRVSVGGPSAKKLLGEERDEDYVVDESNDD